MLDKLLAIRISVLVILTAMALIVWFPSSASSASGNYLTVRFLDVGQGDSIHIETPDGYEMLIDGGPSASVLNEFSANRNFFDKTIDVVVATHPDTDHVAGLVDILERYEVDMILKTEIEHGAAAAQAFNRAAISEEAKLVIAEAGQIIDLGASTTVRVLSPLANTDGWESNTASIVLQIVYGDIEFMLTGDAPESIEDYLVDTYGTDLESEVLKLGHHGSKTSSSEKFLEMVMPELTIVSAGADNRYGHPHPGVLERVNNIGAEVLSTATAGTLTFKTDGQMVWLAD